MTDPAPDGCQICGGAPLEKVLYPVAVHFKGSGFYATDYGRGGRKKEPSRDGDAPAPGGSDAPKDKDKKAAET